MERIASQVKDARWHRGLVGAIRGERGNARIGPIVDAIAGRGFVDPRPPGICCDCFAAWSAAGVRNASVTCEHIRNRAQRYRGRWIVEPVQ